MEKKPIFKQVLPYVFVFFVSFDLLYNLFIEKTPVLRSVFFVIFFVLTAVFYRHVLKKDELGAGITIAERIFVWVAVLLLGFMFFSPMFGLGKYWQLALPPFLCIGVYVLIGYIVIPFFEGLNAVQLFCRDRKIQLIRGPIKSDFVPNIFYFGDLPFKENDTIPFAAVSDIIEINPDFKMFTNTYKSYTKEGYYTEVQFCVFCTVRHIPHYHRMLLKGGVALPIRENVNVNAADIALRYCVVSDNELEANGILVKIRGPLLRLAGFFKGTTTMDGVLVTDLDMHIRDKYLLARIGFAYRHQIEDIYLEFKEIHRALTEGT